MTALEQLADFIASPDGEIYGRYCERYGKDPGAIFSDDVIAFQVGLAYMVRDSFGKEPETDDGERPEGGVITDLEMRMR